MSRRFLVVVHAGDRSQHPQWLAQNTDRNWDLVVHYHGSDPQRYPVSGDGVVRIDGKGPKWASLHTLLADTRDAWRAYDYVWFPDDDLVANGADINRMFELMAGLGLDLAQPSLAWDSHVDALLALHNPSFAVRYSSFVESWAPCFSRALLERVLPTFSESTTGAGLGYVWPRHLQNPATQCAIVDRVQVKRARAAQEPADLAGVEALLKKHGVPDVIQLSYGAIDRDGTSYNLFDAEKGEFVFRLCDGYRGVLGDQFALLGAVFGAHAKARAEVLSPAEARAPAAPAAAAPQATGGNALDRFRTAVAAAAANGAGRVAAPTHG